MTNDKKQIKATEDNNKPNSNALSSKTKESKKQSTQQTHSVDYSIIAKKSRRLSVFAIVLSIVLSSVLLFLAKNSLDQQQAKMTQLESELTQAKSSLTGELETINKQVTTIIKNDNTHEDQQNKSIKSLQVNISDIKGRSPNDWLIAEANYLVKMAGRKLWLEHDVTTAIALMEGADQRIAALNNPSMTPLREAIAKDITTLKAIPIIDYDGIIIQLDTLAQQINKLPLANAILPTDKSVEEETISNDINDWQANLMQSLKDFAGHFITYRIREGNVIPLLSPEQHFYLKENMKGKLTLAANAVYREQSEVYSHSLNSALTWASQYFQQDDPVVIGFMKQLESLSQYKIDVEYPEKMETQASLALYISEKLRRNIQAMNEETVKLKKPLETQEAQTESTATPASAPTQKSISTPISKEGDKE